MRTPEQQKVYERRKKWRAENREKVKAAEAAFHAKNPRWNQNRHLRRAYGLTWDDYCVVLELQGNGCAVCGSLSSQRLTRNGKPALFMVDHCHETGKVRGIVCHPCNVALGAVRDNPKTLRALAAYLEKAQ